MKIKTKDLLEVLDHLKFVFINNNYIDDSKFVFFNTRENMIWAYSDTITYKYQYTGSLKEMLETDLEEVVLPAKELYTLLRKIKKDEIDIKQKGDSIVIKNGRSSNTFVIEKIIPDNRKLEMKLDCRNTLPENLNHSFKNYCVFDKNFVKSASIVFEEGFMVSSDRYNFVKIDCMSEGDSFAVKWDMTKHVLDMDLLNFSVFGDVVSFSDGVYTILTNNTLKNSFEYKSVFDNMEEIDYAYSIYMNKEENIDFVDAFLLNYKKPDKKVQAHVASSNRMFITARGNKGTEETRATIELDKYRAGEPEKFLINVDYFKSVYKDYDYFNVFDGMLYLVNVEDCVERICRIENLEK